MPKTEKQDRRTKRTRRNLRAALHSLILEKGYDGVTVQDIADRADVGRSTFYAHFENKDQLHLSGFDLLADGLRQTGEPGDDFNFDSLPLFRHAAESRRMYRALAGKESGEMFLKNMLRRTREIVLQELRESFPDERKDSFETKAAAHFYASSLVAMITFWLDSDLPLSPEETNELFKKLALRGLKEMTD